MTAGTPPAQLIARVLGRAPTSIVPTESPYAWLLDLDGQPLVAKTSPPTRPSAVLIEAWAYQMCRTNGARVPAVVAVSDDPACMIVEALPGQSLWTHGRSAHEARAIWTTVGNDLRAIHAIRVAGFGPLAMTNGSRPRGEAAHWCPWVRSAREYGLAYLANAGYLSAATAQRLERRLTAAAPVLHACTDGRLLHGDLEGGHVWSTPAGAYTGLIDFGLAQGGDPRWDLARVMLWDGPDALEALLDGYGHEAVTAEDRAVVLPLYLLAFVIHQSVQLARAGRRDAVEEHLQQVL